MVSFKVMYNRYNPKDFSPSTTSTFMLLTEKKLGKNSIKKISAAFLKT